MIYKLSKFPNQIIGFEGERTAYIPKNETNSDYADYLKWLEEDGNQPLPADEPVAES
jgi:hypothetical protein